MSRRYLTNIIGCLGLVVVPSVAAAQSNVKASVSSSSFEKALAAREQAVALYDKPARAADAARLHLTEANYRSIRDPEAVEALAMAAHMFSYAERPLEARRAMEKAAERALAIGDVSRAARAYIDAAFFALKTSSAWQTQRLGRKALLLSDSPLLDHAERSAIRQRLTSNPTLAQVIQ